MYERRYTNIFTVGAVSGAVAMDLTGKAFGTEVFILSMHITVGQFEPKVLTL
jgi:hypothetical protein